MEDPTAGVLEEIRGARKPAVNGRFTDVCSWLMDGDPAVRWQTVSDLLASPPERVETWPTYASYPGREWFRMEKRGPSRWSTLRAHRVLRWWAGGEAHGAVHP